jgi:hypothetical protein
LSFPERKTREQGGIHSVLLRIKLGKSDGTRMNDSTRTPEHLPERLTICSWQWPWITSSGPGEPYHDLEAVMNGLRERGYNAIRIDAGPDWCFAAGGKPRGEMAFTQAYAGYNMRFRVINGRDGVRCDVLERVVELMRLAGQYDIYVILTCWEYMHCNGLVVDPAIRDAVNAMPRERRLMHLARQEDRLLRILKDRGLQQNVAYVEPHNEVNFSDLPGDEEGRKYHEEAIAFLREVHPDLLISADFGRHLPEQIPDNTQVYDIHVYAGAFLYFDVLYRQTVDHPNFDPAEPRKLPLLDYLLEPHIVPYEAFTGEIPNVGSGWAGRLWLYHNLDIGRFDRWFLERYAERETDVKSNARCIYAEIAREADRRSLPVTIEEGGFFYAPLHSRFEESEAALDYFEFITDLAIEHGFWGFLPTTYNGPECPVWWERPKWLRENNTRFLEGRDREGRTNHCNELECRAHCKGVVEV